MHSDEFEVEMLKGALKFALLLLPISVSDPEHLKFVQYEGRWQVKKRRVEIDMQCGIGGAL